MDSFLITRGQLEFRVQVEVSLGLDRGPLDRELITINEHLSAMLVYTYMSSR